MNIMKMILAKSVLNHVYIFFNQLILVFNQVEKEKMLK